MENVKIRSAKPTDIPIILGILYELGRPKPKKDAEVDFFRKLVKKYLKDSDKEILVAENNQVEILGLASIMYLSRLNQTKNEMYIPELIVLEKFQNQGIGKLLIDSCEKLAKEKNCFRIRLESGMQRENAHEFYKKLGFTHTAHFFSKCL